MIGPHAISPVEKAGYGLGVIHVGDGPTARIGHAGEDPGVQLALLGVHRRASGSSSCRT